MKAKRAGGAGGFFIPITILPALVLAGLLMAISAKAQSGLQREVYTNIWGIEVADLTNAPKFPDHPDFVNSVPSFETPSMFGDNYGERLRGYLLPPMTGNYVFYVASDDQGVLFLSPDTNAANKRVIAYEATWSPPRSWTGIVAGRTNAGNISSPIFLQAGHAYYVEALHKEGGGGDNFAVAWKMPGGLPPTDGSEPIGGEFLSIACPSETNHVRMVAIVTPTEGSVFLPGTNILLGAEASDPEDRPLQVGFFEGARFIGRGVPAVSSDRNRYVWMWSNVVAGSYTLSARATDTDGLTVTSAPVHITVGPLVPPGPEELHVVGIYSGEFNGSSSPNHEEGYSSVLVDRPGQRVTLFLSAYEPVLWSISISEGTRLQKVILSGVYAQRVQGIGPEVQVISPVMCGNPIWLWPGYTLDSARFYEALPKLHALTGLEISSFQGAYTAPHPIPFRIDTVQNDPRLRSDYPQPTPVADLPDLSFRLAFFSGSGPSTGGRVFFQDFTVAGPAMGGDLLPGMRVVPDAGKRYFYAAYPHEVLRVDSETGTAQQMQVGPGLPELSWPMGMAFDSTRNRELLVSLGGEGFLYAYAPETAAWSVVASLQNRDLDSVVYHAAQDAIYGFEVFHGDYGPPRLFRFDAQGLYHGEIQLPVLPFGAGVGGYQSELVSVGDYLLLLLAPDRNFYGGTESLESRMYLIDPRSNQVWLTYRHTRSDQPPSIAITSPQEGAILPVGSPIPLTAQASDPAGRVHCVEFLANDKSLGLATSTGGGLYKLDWTGVQIGSYTLRAKATYDDFATVLSAPVHFTLTAQPSPLMVTSTADSGPGSLRQVVAAAPPGATITFDVTGAINLTSGAVPLNKPLTLQGPGAQMLAIQRAEDVGTLEFRIFSVASPAVTINGLTIRGGKIGGSSDYDDGAGIENRGELLLNRCVVSDNQALGEYSRGGGICTHSGAKLTVYACTFAGNSASGYYGEGGAIYNYGYLAVTNSTFSGNSAGGWGGAVHNDMMSQGTFLDSCTFTANRGGFGGGIFNRGSPPSHVSPVYLRNTIVAGNQGEDIGHCSLILSGGYNLIGTIADPYGGSLALPFALGLGDRTNVTAAQVRLGPLQLNGGTTPTHAPLSHSLAIDMGPGEVFPPFDQRDFPRPFGPRSDVGAVESNQEFSNTPPSVVCPEPAQWQATSPAGATGTLTVSVRDMDGDDLVVIWSLDGVPARTNAVPGCPPETSVNVAWTLTLLPGVHSVQVAVSDGQAAPAACSTTVIVLPRLQPPLVVNRTISGNAIRLSAELGNSVSVYAVEDHLPAGWEIVGISAGGVFDRVTGKVKFGPYFDHEARTFNYTALAPPGFVGVGHFTGFGSADGLLVPITGDNQMLIAPPHPADLRPQDWVLRIDEVTAYAAAWRTGGVWAIPPNPIPIDYVTRAASLWQGGESYMLDPEVGGPPLWWVNVTPTPVYQKQNLRTMVSALRRVPAGYVAGESVEVVVEVTPIAGVSSYAVEEAFPAGWLFVGADGNAALDSANRRLKWGPFYDAIPRTLRYHVLPGVDSKGTAEFMGNVSADGRLAAIGGASELRATARLVWTSQPEQGRWSLQLKGTPGSVYLIESSTNLLRWSPLAVVTNAFGSAEIPRPAGQDRQQFYRAKSLD